LVLEGEYGMLSHVCILVVLSELGPLAMTRGVRSKQGFGWCGMWKQARWHQCCTDWGLGADVSFRVRTATSGPDIWGLGRREKGSRPQPKKTVQVRHWNVPALPTLPRLHNLTLLTSDYTAFAVRYCHASMSTGRWGLCSAQHLWWHDKDLRVLQAEHHPVHPLRSPTNECREESLGAYTGR